MNSVLAPASESCLVYSSASAFVIPSLIDEGAPSTKPFASLSPKPVIALTALMTSTFFSPTSVKLRFPVTSSLSSPTSAVSPAAGAAAAAPAAGETAEVGEDNEDVTGNLNLTDVGEKKVEVIKAVRAITGLGLKDAKGLVDGAPSSIKEGITKAEADEYTKQLSEAGAKTEFK